MTYKTKDYIKLLYLLAQEKEKGELALWLNIFLRLVKENGDESKIEIIIKKFTEYYDEMEGIVSVKTFTVRPLTEKTKKVIANYIKKLKPGARTVQIKEQYDESLLAGTRIIMDDMVFDMTAKKQLNYLEKCLAGGKE